MTCEAGSILSSNNSIDLEKNLNDDNLRTMAINSNNSILQDVGGQIQFGRRNDMFWVVMSVIVGSILILTKLFGRKKSKRR